jgi:hypothetical protein
MTREEAIDVMRELAQRWIHEAEDIGCGDEGTRLGYKDACEVLDADVKISHWESNPAYPVEDWRYEVANDDTRLGYLDWVEAKLESEQTAPQPHEITP